MGGNIQSTCNVNETILEIIELEDSDFTESIDASVTHKLKYTCFNNNNDVTSSLTVSAIEEVEPSVSYSYDDQPLKMSNLNKLDLHPLIDIIGLKFTKFKGNTNVCNNINIENLENLAPDDKCNIWLNENEQFSKHKPDDIPLELPQQLLQETNEPQPMEYFTVVPGETPKTQLEKWLEDSDSLSLPMKNVPQTIQTQKPIIYDASDSDSLPPKRMIDLKNEIENRTISIPNQNKLNKIGNDLSLQIENEKNNDVIEQETENSFNNQQPDFTTVTQPDRAISIVSKSKKENETSYGFSTSVSELSKINNELTESKFQSRHSKSTFSAKQDLEPSITIKNITSNTKLSNTQQYSIKAVDEIKEPFSIQSSIKSKILSKSDNNKDSFNKRSKNSQEKRQDSNSVLKSKYFSSKTHEFSSINLNPGNDKDEETVKKINNTLSMNKDSISKIIDDSKHTKVSYNDVQKVVSCELSSKLESTSKMSKVSFTNYKGLKNDDKSKNFNEPKLSKSELKTNNSDKSPPSLALKSEISVSNGEKYKSSKIKSDSTFEKDTQLKPNLLKNDSVIYEDSNTIQNPEIPMSTSTKDIVAVSRISQSTKQDLTSAEVAKISHRSSKTTKSEIHLSNTMKNKSQVSKCSSELKRNFPIDLKTHDTYQRSHEPNDTGSETLNNDELNNTSAISQSTVQLKPILKSNEEQVSQNSKMISQWEIPINNTVKLDSLHCEISPTVKSDVVLTESEIPIVVEKSEVTSNLTIEILNSSTTKNDQTLSKIHLDTKCDLSNIKYDEQFEKVEVKNDISETTIHYPNSNRSDLNLNSNDELSLTGNVKTVSSISNIKTDSGTLHIQTKLVPRSQVTKLNRKNTYSSSRKKPEKWLSYDKKYVLKSGPVITSNKSIDFKIDNTDKTDENLHTHSHNPNKTTVKSPENHGTNLETKQANTTKENLHSSLSSTIKTLVTDDVKFKMNQTDKTTKNSNINVDSTNPQNYTTKTSLSQTVQLQSEQIDKTNENPHSYVLPSQTKTPGYQDIKLKTAQTDITDVKIDLCIKKLNEAQAKSPVTPLLNKANLENNTQDNIENNIKTQTLMSLDCPSRPQVKNKHKKKSYPTYKFMHTSLLDEDRCMSNPIKTNKGKVYLSTAFPPTATTKKKKKLTDKYIENFGNYDFDDSYETKVIEQSSHKVNYTKKQHVVPPNSPLTSVTNNIESSKSNKKYQSKRNETKNVLIKTKEVRKENNEINKKKDDTDQIVSDIITQKEDTEISTNDISSKKDETEKSQKKEKTKKQKNRNLTNTTVFKSVKYVSKGAGKKFQLKKAKKSPLHGTKKNQPSYNKIQSTKKSKTKQYSRVIPKKTTFKKPVTTALFKKTLKHVRNIVDDGDKERHLVKYSFYTYFYPSETDEGLLPFYKRDIVEAIRNLPTDDEYFLMRAKHNMTFSDRRIQHVERRCDCKISIFQINRSQLIRSLPRRRVTISANSYTAIVRALIELENSLPELIEHAVFHKPIPIKTNQWASGDNFLTRPFKSAQNFHRRIILPSTPQWHYNILPERIIPPVKHRQTYRKPSDRVRYEVAPCPQWVSQNNIYNLGKPG